MRRVVRLSRAGLEQLFSKMSCSLPGLNCRDEFYEDAKNALSQYRLVKSSDLGALPTDFSAADFRVYIFPSLWSWKSTLKISQRRDIYGELLKIHLIGSGPPLRSEFAFLVGWTGGLAWTKAIPAMRVDAYAQIKSELAELVETLSEEQAVRTFFGLGSGHARGKKPNIRATTASNRY